MTGHAMSQAVSAGLPALTLWGAFLLGLLGSVTHCAAMCGPLVAAVGLAEGTAKAAADGTAAASDGARCDADASTGPSACARPSSAAAWRFHVGFHAGRLFTYVLIGALLGILAENDVLERLAGPAGSARLAAFLRAGAGALMVAVGLVLIAGPLLGRRVSLPEPTAALARQPWFTRTVGRLSRTRAAWGLPLGAVMGLLPCAPLLPVELAALGSGSAAGGALVMFAFGIGTLPLLGAFGALAGLLGTRTRTALLPVSGLAVAVLGAWTIAQAVALVA